MVGNMYALQMAAFNEAYMYTHLHVETFFLQMEATQKMKTAGQWYKEK